MKIKLGIKSILITVAIVGIVLLSGFGIMGLTNPQNHKESIERISVRPVKAKKLSSLPSYKTRSFPGVVKAAKESKLAFRVGGPLISFDVNIGQKVKEGDILAQIDPRDYEIAIARIEAGLSEAKIGLKAMRKGARKEDIALLESQLAAAQAQLAEAAANYKRFEALHEQKAAAGSAFDRAKTGYELAKAGVAAAEKSLEKARTGARPEEIEAMEAKIKGLHVELRSAKNMLEDTKLKAPFDGVVNKKFVENFETVGPGQPIVSILDFRQVEITISIPEELLIHKDAVVRYYCKLPSLPDRVFDAQFKEIGLNTTDSTQSYPLTVVMNIPDDMTVRPGMAADVFVDVKTSDRESQGFLIPLAAVFSDPAGTPSVWKIDPEKMTIHKTSVKQGELYGDLIRIESELDEGDMIVTAGARFLREGQHVRLMK